MPNKPMNNAGAATSFKGALKRLFHELEGYRKLVFLAVILAILGAVLSILAPNQLSNITDEISQGLVINRDNLTAISESITAELSEEKMTAILDMSLSPEVLSDPSLTAEERESLLNFVQNEEADFTSFLELPDTLFQKILTDSTYQGTEISKEDKLAFIKYMKGEDTELSDSFVSLLFPPITVSGTTLTSDDQYTLANAFKSVSSLESTAEIYEMIDTLPDHLKALLLPTMNLDKIKQIALLLVGMYVCSGLFTYIQAICMTNVSNRFAFDLRKRITKKINCLPLKYFDKHYTGDTLSRVTNDVDTIHQAMNQSLGSLASSVTLFLGSILIMFITNWILALTAIISSLIGFMGMLVVLSKSQKYFVQRQEELGNLNGHIEEVYSGLNVVKVYNGRELADQKFDTYNDKVCKSSYKSQFLSGLMMPMMSFIGNFGYVMVCIVGALLTMNDVITFGVIIAFISYVRLFTSPLSQIAQAMTSLQSAAAASERVFEFIDEPEMTNEEDITLRVSKDEVKGDITFYSGSKSRSENCDCRADWSWKNDHGQFINEVL